MNINEMAAAAHKNAVAKGFYDEPPSVDRRLNLIHSEVSEACEADRKDHYCAHIAAKESLEMDDKRFKEYFMAWIKGSFWDEMADVVIRIGDFAAAQNVNLEAHVEAKMRYNSMRPYKHEKNY
jgi:hypothetical protein